MSDTIKLTNKIKLHRTMNDMTQESLANKVGCTRQTINAIEKNKYSPSLVLAFKIAKIFNKEINDIFNVE